MQESNTPKNGGGASVSRRKFMAFAAGGAAATLPAVAIAAASEKTDRLPRTLQAQLDDSIEQLKFVLQQMHPHAEMRGQLEVFNRGRDFWFLLVGNAPPTCEWTGDGLYELAESKQVSAGVYTVERTYSHMDGRFVLRARDMIEGKPAVRCEIVDANQLIRKLEGGAA